MMAEIRWLDCELDFECECGYHDKHFNIDEYDLRHPLECECGRTYIIRFIIQPAQAPDPAV